MNLTDSNLITLNTELKEGQRCIRIGNSIIPVGVGGISAPGAGGADVTLGVVDSQGRFQALRFNGTQASNSGSAIQVQNYKSWNSTLPAPEQTPLIVTPTQAITACTIFSSKRPCLYFSGSAVWWISKYRSDWAEPAIGDYFVSAAGNNGDSDFYVAWTTGRAVCVKGYQIRVNYSSGYGISSWYLQGSNDCNSWTTIQEDSKQSEALTYFSVATNNTQYMYHRIKVKTQNTYPGFDALMAFSRDIGTVYTPSN